MTHLSKALLCMALAACGPAITARPTTFSVAVSNDLRGHEVERAIADLNAKAGCALVNVVTDGAPAEWAISETATLGQLDGGAEEVGGQTDYAAHTIKLSTDDTVPEDDYLITLHEIGHAFGLQHHGNGVMAAGAMDASFDWTLAWPEYLADLNIDCEAP